MSSSNSTDSHMLQDSVALATEVKRRILKDGGKNRNLLTKKIKNLQQELKVTKQNIVQHVLQSRAIEQSKAHLMVIQQSLHSVLMEKNEPEFLQTVERRKNAITFNYTSNYPLHSLQLIDHLIDWNFPGLLKHLIDKLYTYSNKDFINALEANPLSDDQITVELYIQIVSNGTNFMLSNLEIEEMYHRGESIYSFEQARRSPEELQKKNISLWSTLKRILYRKLIFLYVIQQASLFINELEKKLHQKEHFQYQLKSDSLHHGSISSAIPHSTTAHGKSSVHSHLSSISVDSLPSKNLLSSSLTSLDLKKKKLPPTSTTSLTTYSSASTTSSPRSKLEIELQKSLLQQNMLQEKIISNFNQIVLQESQERKEELHLQKGKEMLLNPLESSILSSQQGMQLLSKKKLHPTPAMKQYYFNIGFTKLFQFLSISYLQKLLQRRFNQWRKITSFVTLSTKITSCLKQVGYYRLLRVLEFNQIRRLSNRLDDWKLSHQKYKQRERLSAAINIQRFWRGFLARRLRQKISSERAATCINGIMKIFFAKKMLRFHRLKKLQQLSSSKIAFSWKKCKFRHIINQRIEQKRQMKSIYLIQRIYRGHRGRKKAKARQHYLHMIKGALKLQSLFRRYKATIRVDRIRYHKKRLWASILIQKHIRRKLQALRFNKIWKRHCQAKLLQYFWLCCKARKRYKHLLQIRSAKRIQRIIRGKLGRNRFAYFCEQNRQRLLRRQQAILRLKPLLLGWITRRKYGPLLQSHYSKRNKAAATLQMHFQAIIIGQKTRQHLQELQKLELLDRLKWKAAIKIQTRMRMFLAKRLVNYLIEQRKRRELLEELKIPYYYRLKKTYISQQNTFHYKYAVRIQCLIRKFLARHKIKRVKLQNEINFIESVKKRHDLHLLEPEPYQVLSTKLLSTSKSARIQTGISSIDENDDDEDNDPLMKIILLNNPSLKSSKSFRGFSGKDGKLLSYRGQLESFQRMYAILIQKIFRGWRYRIKQKRNKAILPIKWFCRELIIRSKIKAMKSSWRTIKAERERQRLATTRIQKLIRGILQRRKYKKNYRMLVRQREIRIRNKRIKCALMIQCAFRQYRARKRIRKQRKYMEEKEKEKKELQLLEESIIGLHQRWMHELLAIRAQTGVRGYLARSEFAKRVEEFKKKEQEEKRIKRDIAAAMIQKLIRGVLARKLFKKNLPNLRKAQKMKILCSQCEKQIALRRCRQCRDRFCNECYDLIHAKGNRKKHSWENIKVDARMMAMAYETGNNMNTGSPAKAGTMSGFSTRHNSMYGGGGGGAMSTRPSMMMSGPGGNLNMSTMNNNTNNNANGGEPKKKVNPKDWEEFYDESARAKYWYNKVTGEASWVNPLK